MKITNWIYLVALAIQMAGVESSHITGIEFTSKTSDYFNVTFDSEVNYSQGFTICLRVMFSYLNSNKLFDSQNIVGLTLDDYDSGNMIISLMDFNHHCQWPSQILDLQPYVWYVFCISFDPKENLARFTINDIIIFRESRTQIDPENIGYSTQFKHYAEMPFVGKITDFNVWNRSLSDLEIQNFVSCNNGSDINAKLKVFSWFNANLTNIGNLNQIILISMEDICSHPAPPKVRWFHTPVSFESAMIVSHNLKSEMYLPSNTTTHQDLLASSDLSKFCRNTIWVPIVRSNKNSSLWVNAYNLSEEVKYLPWLEGQPNGYPMQNCVIAELNDFGYKDIECQDEICFNVYAAKSPIFRLRGPFVTGENFDSKYVYYFEDKSNENIFQGFSGKSMIIKNNDYWDLKIYNNTLKNFQRIALLKNRFNLPFGAQNWTFTYKYENIVGRDYLIKLTKVRILHLKFCI